MYSLKFLEFWSSVANHRTPDRWWIFTGIFYWILLFFSNLTFNFFSCELIVQMCSLKLFPIPFCGWKWRNCLWSAKMVSFGCFWTVLGAKISFFCRKWPFFGGFARWARKIGGKGGKMWGWWSGGFFGSFPTVFWSWVTVQSGWGYEDYGSLFIFRMSGLVSFSLSNVFSWRLPCKSFAMWWTRERVLYLRIFRFKITVIWRKISKF